jgi:hypothetical protein
MAIRIKLSAKALAFALFILVALYFLGRLIFAVIWRLFSFTLFLVQIFLPLLVLAVLAWFVYRVWGRSHLRARKIDRIRNARYLKEAVDRGKESN